MYRFGNHDVQNFIIVCVDCLRYDSFNRALDRCNGLREILARRSTSFDSAFATSPWTYPSTNSILTSLYPHRHGARQSALYKNSVREPWPTPLNSDLPTLFSQFKLYGYHTFGVSTIFWALNEACQYHGCDRIIRSSGQDLTYKKANSEWVIAQFAEHMQLRPQHKPFITYLHLSDLHRSIDLNVATRYLDGFRPLPEGLEGWDIRPYLFNPAIAMEFKASKLRVYEAATCYVLEQITELIRQLETGGLIDETTLILTGDHGEEFWDHEDFERDWYDCGYRSKQDWLLGTGHGHTLFDELVHVPLVIINPGSEIPDKPPPFPVSLVDIFPTVLQLAGLPAPDSLDGRTLLEAGTRQRVLVQATLYGHERKALIDQNWKYIYSPNEHGLISYDRAHDPLERSPLVNHNESVLAALGDLFALDKRLFDESKQ